MGNMVKLKIELRDIGAKRVVPEDMALESLHGVAPTIKDILETLSEEAIRGAPGCAEIPAGISRAELVAQVAETGCRRRSPRCLAAELHALGCAA